MSEPMTPEQPRTDELQLGDRLVEWKHMERFTVTAIEPLPDHLWYDECRSDGSYPTVSGMRITGRAPDGETVQYVAAISRRWQRDTGAGKDTAPSGESTRAEQPLTAEQEHDIRTRLTAASHGPWSLSYERCCCTEDDECGYYVSRLDTGAGPATELRDLPAEDWELMAHAPADIRALLAELDRTRDALRDARNLITEDGHEVCADCGKPAEDGPCSVHSPDDAYRRACGQGAELRARVAELEAERAKYVGKEPTIAEEMAYLSNCIDSVLAVCDTAEQQATRWENPLPVPEWVEKVRAAANGLTERRSYPPALPWAALMDHEDMTDFLDELGAAAITHADSTTALAEVEDTCGRWRLIAEAQHAHNTADGPDAAEEPISATQQCGHDDYHDAHQWADKPHIWCPGHSFEADAAEAGDDRA